MEPKYAAALYDGHGLTLYYTGRAGDGYLSADKGDAFAAYTRDGAETIARRLHERRGSPTAWQPLAVACWPPMLDYDNDGRCHNAEPGTYGHECGKPAAWIGTKADGFRSGFCNNCRRNGYEARAFTTWEPAP